MPGARPHVLAGTFTSDLSLRSDHDTSSVAELLLAGRPVLLDFGGRAELRAAADGWRDRIDVVCAETVQRPADAILIRPDAHIAWAARIDEPADTAVPEVREALSSWFGTALGGARS